MYVRWSHIYVTKRPAEVKLLWHMKTFTSSDIGWTFHFTRQTHTISGKGLLLKKVHL